MATSTDRIEKKVMLKASRARVWRALTNVDEFNAWFGVKLVGELTPGKPIRGNITHKGYEHLTMEIVVEKMEPEKLYSYRWHPYAIDPKIDYSKEPTTLVEFQLEDAPGGTHLTIVESGFDELPAARRDEAFRMNDGGWTQQAKNLEKHVAS